MPRVKLFDVEDAVKKAMELFWAKGYASTSLSDLTEHLGIGKGSFYATFGSKEELFTTALDHYKKSSRDRISALLNSESDVRIGLRKFLEYNLEELLKYPEGKGCFISNTSSEHTRFNDVFKNLFVNHFQSLKEELIDYLIAGNIAKDRVGSIVDSVITFIIGMSHQTKFDRDREHYLKSIDHLVALLD